jgi:hypothetical protein
VNPLLVIFILMPLAALIVIAARAGRVEEHDKVVVVRGGPSEVVNDLLVAIANVKSCDVAQRGSDHLAVRTYFSPAWAIFVAIAFFPIGLVALFLAREHLSAVIIVSEGAEPGLTRIRLGGQFDRRVIYRVNQVIGARS